LRKLAAWFMWKHSGQQAMRVSLFPVGWQLFSEDFSPSRSQWKHLQTWWEMGQAGLHFYLGVFPKCLLYSVSIADKVSNTLWAFPKPIRCWPKGLHHINVHFLFIFLEVQFSHLHLLNINDATENFQTISGSSPSLIFPVRYHTEGSMKLNARILILAHMVYL
jgi:hypothetical protein